MLSSTLVTVYSIEMLDRIPMVRMAIDRAFWSPRGPRLYAIVAAVEALGGR